MGVREMGDSKVLFRLEQKIHLSGALGVWKIKEREQFG